MASTMGTARGSTQGSWRPRPLSSVSSLLDVTVFCSVMMVAVGLNATLKEMFSPLEMPPWTPPERLLVVRTVSPSMTKGSLCSAPVSWVPPKPEPIARLGAMRMTYGAYLGSPLREVPRDKLDWYLQAAEQNAKSLRAYLTHPEIDSYHPED